MKNQSSITSEANILVVDDTPVNLRLLIDILSEQNYTVRPAVSGSQALSAVREELPDLILLDVKMPEMDGYEICNLLKADKNTCDIPIIFISALGELHDKVAGFSAGGIDYITKPFQAEEVLARVQTHVMLRRLHQHLQKKNRQLEREIEKREQAEEELRILNGNLKEANQQLQDSNRRLQQANADKDKFFSIIAHDLRGPFTGLLGMTGTLLESIEDYKREQIKTQMSQLYASAKTVYTLLTNLLEWSRLRRGLMKYYPEAIVLKAIVNSNIRLLAAYAERKQITLRNRLSDEMLVYADHTMLDGVVRNLLSNALKFTEAGGTIEVSAQARKRRIEITFSDTGIGIHKKDLNNLFRIEAKSSRQGTDGEEGSGLGLILCKEFIEKNNGTLSVESELKKGSSFIVSLPAYDE